MRLVDLLSVGSIGFVDLTSLLALTLGALSSLAPLLAASRTNENEPMESFISPHPATPSSPPQSEDPPSSSRPADISPQHPLFVSTSTSPAFLRAIGVYLSQRDEAVRRCGMLVAEMIAGGGLNFGDWGEVGGGGDKTAGAKKWQVWAVELRAQASDPLRSVQEEVVNWETEHPSVDEHPGPDIDALELESHPDPAPQSGMDIAAKKAGEAQATTPSVPDPDSDDDSLIGYASPSPTSSRAPSPTPSELEDPTLRRRPIPRPVYLAELGAMLLDAPKNIVEVQPGAGFPGFGGSKGRRGMGITGGRGGGDAEDEKSRVDMALEVGAELIRRKRGYGSELGASNCVCFLASLC